MSRRRSRSRRPQAKKVFCFLDSPFVSYGTKQDALSDRPDKHPDEVHQFDSTMEYSRYLYLLACEQEGLISELVPHPGTFEIAPQIVLPKNAMRPAIRTIQHRVYTPDFNYMVDGVLVFEDFKGYVETAGASLQHSLFIHYLLSVLDAKDFHFKRVYAVESDPCLENDKVTKKEKFGKRKKFGEKS